VSWHDLTAYGEANPDDVSALWQRLKDEAAKDLFTGARVGKALERPLAARPLDRAAFLVILGGLRTSLEPRDALELLLVQQMASAFEMHLRWQKILVRRMEEEVWQAESDKRRVVETMSRRERERYEDSHGWLPPRLAETEALEQAAILADRSQRQFLRLMKAFRDNRKQFSALIVAGGQVNIGEQQINVAENVSTPAMCDRAPSERRTMPTRVNKRAKSA
jgi:hypothetical protein